MIHSEISHSEMRPSEMRPSEMRPSEMRPSLTVRRVHEILQKWLSSTAHNVGVLGDDFPDYYDPRKGDWALNGGWTEGFWTGILWQLYAYSRDARFKKWAQEYTRLLARQKADFTDHDLGFLFYHSCVLEHLITGEQEMIPAALSAANRLADRFNPQGRFIRAHGELSDPERAGYAIIDTIMNLRLLFWAYNLTGETRFLDVARETALTIGREYLREDDSSYQVVWFDPATGQVEKKETLQGYNTDSCWSRGQAWGIYGLAQVYKYTGERHFKDWAHSMARYFIHHLPGDGVVYYDFVDPRIPDVPKDTSAQAIAAAGLLTLSELAVGEERGHYLAQGERLLAPLCAEYLVQPEPGYNMSRGFLRGGCYFLAQDRGVDSELMFGDYYMLEALVRYLSVLMWQ
jgi:unsaturated chondroitin disaccharide hydrolase